MTDTERGEERKHQVERYRLLAQEITDPLAGLLRDINSELEADPLERLAGERRDQKMAPFMPWSGKRRPA
jgi:hypothetical protein